MTTDNRTNEPTPEHVEAAAKAMFEEEKGQTLNGEIWPNWEDLCRCNLNDRMCTHGGKQLPYVLLAHAALVAAAGAAPQASKKSCGPCHRGQHGCCDGNEYLRCECSHGNAPLPSSGVDVEALADAIRKLRFDDEGCWADGIDCAESVSDHADEIARAVAEWLKGQER